MSYRRSLILFSFTLIFKVASATTVVTPLLFSPDVIKSLHEDPEWINLLHYRKNLFGGYKSQVQGKDFFLAIDGPTNPRGELNATLDKFFFNDVDSKKYQCAFLARRDFLIRKLRVSPAAIHTCPEADLWMTKLNPRRTSLIFASGSLSSPPSSFGHIFLKIDDPEHPRGILNYGINFAARTENTTGALYALYGLFGYFPGTYGMAPYHHLIKEYTNLEGRDLWEYELNLNQDETKRMMFHLLELERGYFDYYFLDDNCAFMIGKILEIARPDLRLLKSEEPWVLPLEVLKIVSRKGLISNEAYRPSLRTTFDLKYNNLSTEGKKRIGDLASSRASTIKNKKIMATLNFKELETAQTYFSLKQAKDFDGYNQITYDLSVERANRPEINSEVFIQAPTPLKSTDSFRIAVGRGTQAVDKTNHLIIRPVGHDLLNSNIGHAPYSEFELAKFDLKFSDLGKADFNEITLVNFLSTLGVSKLETPISWGFALRRTRRWELPIRAGYSFDLNDDQQIRWMNFAGVKLQEVGNGNSLILPGLESLVSIHLRHSLRALIGVNYRFNINRERESWNGGIAWEPKENFELRLQHFSENQILLNYYF